MGTIVLRGLASVPSAGCINIQYLAHLHTDRYGPSTIGTLGHCAGTLGCRTFSCFYLEQAAVIWGGITSGTSFVGRMNVATLARLLLGIFVGCFADSISKCFKSTWNCPICCVSHSNRSRFVFVSGMKTLSSCCDSCSSFPTSSRISSDNQSSSSLIIVASSLLFVSTSGTCVSKASVNS